jgi:hypothetical protein
MVKRYSKLLLLAVALLTLAGFITLQRLHTYHEPLERDITLYAVFGHELLGGRDLYSDLWDIKPPVIYLTYAVAEKLVGYGPGQIYLLGIFTAVITLLGVYMAGSGLGARTSTGLWAAAFWTALCSDLYLQANQPNTEAFINACLIWAFALLLRARPYAVGLGRFFVIGLLFVLASFYKPVVALIAIMLSFIHLALARGASGRWRAAIQLVTIGVIGIVSWVGTCGYFYASGRFAPFYETMFVFNRYYAGNFLNNFRAAMHWEALIPPFLGIMAASLLVPAVLGMVIGLSKKPRRPWLLLLGFTLGTQLALTLPGKFFPHYYQLWLPLLVVAAAWGLEELELSKLCRPFVPMSVGAAVLAIVLIYELPFYRLTAEEWTQRKYSKDTFVSSKKMGKELGVLLAPGETFYEWGFETGLYFYSKRRPPSGVLCAWPLVTGPIVQSLSARVLKDLEHSQPEMFLTLEKDSLDAKQLHPVLQWAKSRYRLWAVRPPFVLYVRKESQMEARMNH